MKFRSVLKGLSWRAFAAFDTMLVATMVMFFRTGHVNSSVFALAGSIVGMELFSKTFLFVVHERLWERATVAVDATPERATSHEELLAQLDAEYATRKTGEAAE